MSGKILPAIPSLFDRGARHARSWKTIRTQPMMYAMFKIIQKIRRLSILQFEIFILQLLLFACSCDKSATEPPPPPPAGPDTTNHNFVWRIDTLGDGNSSIIRDVFIVDENNIWVVGDISIKDSSGNFITTPFGAAHWNGYQWQLFQLPAQTPPGYTSYLRPKGIFALASNDLWLASGGVHRFNGSIIQSYWINDFPGNPNPILDPGQSPEKLWGISNTDMYVVGKQGTVAHFNGTNWQKIESGTSTDINDIWGITDSLTGKSHILAAVGDRYSLGDYGILKFEGLSAKDTLAEGLPVNTTLHTVWFSRDSPIYIGGGHGVFYHSGSQWVEVDLPQYFPTRIRGNAANDVFVCGAFGLFAHYNGSSWRVYQGFSGSLEGLAVKDDVVVAVGTVNSRGLVIIGRRF